jgi:hypothetical protein
VKFVVEHKLDPETEMLMEEVIKQMKEKLQPALEDLKREWQRTVYVGIGAGFVVGLTTGFVVGKAR